MWTLKPTENYVRCRKRYDKKRRRELQAVEMNLATYFAALQVAKPLQIKYGFLHPEPSGVVAIDQKGGGHGKLAETRLYVFADVNSQTLYLFAIGDKNTQEDDVQFCKECVAGLNLSKMVQKNDTAKEQGQESPPGSNGASKGL